MTKTRIIAAVAIVTMLTACGNSRSDRALSGAGIGAGVGAVGSSIVGGGLLPGAVVGGVVGAAAGGLTSKDQVDLGRPAWK